MQSSFVTDARAKSTIVNAIADGATENSTSRICVLYEMCGVYRKSHGKRLCILRASADRRKFNNYKKFLQYQACSKYGKCQRNREQNPCLFLTYFDICDIMRLSI